MCSTDQTSQLKHLLLPKQPTRSQPRVQTTSNPYVVHLIAEMLNLCPTQGTQTYLEMLHVGTSPTPQPRTIIRFQRST